MHFLDQQAPNEASEAFWHVGRMRVKVNPKVPVFYQRNLFIYMTLFGYIAFHPYTEYLFTLHFGQLHL